MVRPIVRFASSLMSAFRPNNGQFGNYPVMPTFSATSSFSLPSERDFS
jgi:hypothetical protein